MLYGRASGPPDEWDESFSQVSGDAVRDDGDMFGIALASGDLDVPIANEANVANLADVMGTLRWTTTSWFSRRAAVLPHGREIFTLTSKNVLVQKNGGDARIFAHKTGTSGDAGANMGSAPRDGCSEVVTVVLGSDDGQRFADTTEILDFALPRVTLPTGLVCLP